MLMSTSYTLRQVAKDLETLLAKKRDTQSMPQVKVKPTDISASSTGETPEHDQDAS